MSITGIMALAMTLVILTAGIDLSVGSIMALATCVLAEILVKRHGNLSPAAADHDLNRSGVHRGGDCRRAQWPAHRPAGSAAVHRDAGDDDRHSWSCEMAQRQRDDRHRVRPRYRITICGQRRRKTGHHRDLSGSRGDFLAAARAPIFGRYVRAIGDNAKAALYAGLPIFSVTTAVYTLSGLLSGIAGVLYAAKTNQSDPNAGVGYELDVIAAVVIGGTSLAGGRGTLPGTVVGVLIMGILTNLLGLLNIDANVQMMIKAVIILLAVWRKKAKAVEEPQMNTDKHR